MASPGESEIVLVDPDGDLILEVGKEHDLTENNVKGSQNNESDSDTTQQQTIKPKVLRIRVCSKLMTMCSPVFKAMLNGPFREGRLPLNAAEPPILKLPDDEPVAMVELCKILHHKWDTHVFPFCALATAVAADKYGCATITRSWFRHQFLWKMATGGAYSRLGLAQLVVISYVLDDVEAFYSFSIQAYKRWRTKKDENDAFVSEISSSLPHKVSELLEQAAETYLEKLITSNRVVISEIFGDGYKGNPAGNLTISTLDEDVDIPKVCRKGAGIVAQYIQVLIEFGLWLPQRGDGPPASLEEAICVVRQLAQAHLEDEQPQCKNKDCQTCRLPWEEAIQEMIDWFEMRLHGLCLVCLKRGDLSASNILTKCEEHDAQLARGAFVDRRRDTRDYTTLED
ncbi:hypothetical protein AYO20_04534 [Fonsecaea nubica]|uniref:BTB domain-containing protein n=1 Tax=Fonsecaea nubica TaxID=856822 RepID=A0A178D1S0_9EURO|nr:hypothetical protein AYO20_04534 [Fonsecaea nubica]OAL36120.1 hypothetical protein AYO20_04534 [Fonsecaea nubica]